MTKRPNAHIDIQSQWFSGGFDAIDLVFDKTAKLGNSVSILPGPETGAPNEAKAYSDKIIDFVRFPL